jgi:hypothetical protein
MQSESGKWDPATVIGLKSHDEVLVIGNPAWMPWLFQVAHDISSVKKLSELEQLVREGEEFDKIVVARETSMNHEFFAFAGPLLKRGENESGLFVVFPPDDGWNADEGMNFYYPEARTWKIDTTFGRAFIAEPLGTSWRFYA